MVGTSNDMKFNWQIKMIKKNQFKKLFKNKHILQILHVSTCLSLKIKTHKLRVSQTE